MLKWAKLSARAAAALALAGFFALHQTALAQEAGESEGPTPELGGLFYEVDGDPPPSIGVDTLDSRLVGIDLGQLAEVIESPVGPKDPVTGEPQTPQSLVLNLFDDVVFTGIVEHVERTSSGHALSGRIDGVELGTMTLVVNGSVVVGTVRTPDAVYTIRSAGDGSYVIRQIDESSLPPLGQPLRAPLPTPDTSPPTPPQGQGQASPVTPDDTSTSTPTPGPTVPATSSDVVSGEDQSAGLFSEVEGEPPTSFGVEALASRLVEIEVAELNRVIESPVGTREPVIGKPLTPQTLVLNLFDDVVFTGVVEHVERTSSGHTLWGRLEGVDLGTMTLVVNGNVVVGTIRTLDAVYTIRTAGDGTYVIRQIDESSLPPLSEPPEAPLSPRDTPLQADNIPPDDGSVIDVMVVYTPAAKHREGGRATIEALIDLFVGETNQAYANSEVIHRINLVWKEEVDYIELDSTTDLSRLLLHSDGYMDHVHELRDLYAADLVHLVVGESDVCGKAFIISDESSLVDEPFGLGLTASYCGGLTFAHELGHNMGLLHDRYVVGVPVTGSNYGYVNQRRFEPGAPSSASWRTIMAYPNQCGGVEVGCPTVPYFSNPDKFYNGDSMGVPADNPSTGVDGPADAVGTLNDRREITANYRKSSTSSTPRVGLTLSRYWLPENGGVSIVRATLHRPSSADTILTVSALPAEHVDLSGNGTLIIPAGETVSAGSVRITSVDNDDQTGDTHVEVSATATNSSSQGVIAPGPAELVIIDDETTPVVTLSLTADEIFEWRGRTYVSAMLDNRSSAKTIVRLSASPDEDVSVYWPYEIAIPAGGKVSDGYIRIDTVNDDELMGAKKRVTVSGTARNSEGVAGPESVTLTIIDDEAPYFVLDRIAYTFTTGVAASRVLLRAYFGTWPLTYSISPAPSNGVTFRPGPPARIGVSKTSTIGNEASYTLTATDEDGDTDTMTVSIAVVDGVCPKSSAVLEHEAPGILTDCEALLGSKDFLRGDRSLNWSKHRSIRKWQGVSIVNDRVVGLDLSSFGLSGSVPSELGNLSRLQVLDLSGNELTGPVPPELVNLSSLEHLYLKGNRLSSCIPLELRNVPNNDLDSVRLYNCPKSATPMIPLAPSITQVIGGTGLLRLEWRTPLSDGGSDVIAYDLRYIETSSDETVDSNWTVVQDVWTLGRSALSYQLTGLTDGRQYDLQIRAVNAVGDGPWSTSEPGTPATPSACIAGRAVADVTNKGLVSDCEVLLELRDTLGGSATLNWAADIDMANWEGIRLHGTQRRVTDIELSSRDLSGSVPSELKDVTSLQSLDLSRNQLTGRIPAELGTLINLQRLYLDSNQLTGEIPAKLGNLAQLYFMSLSDNQLEGEIPVSLSNLSRLALLYLNANQLTGEIPTELGNLSKLQWLSLSSNQLTGEIPVRLGDIAFLQWLNLNSNQLTGNMPAELGKLTHLRRLNLSYNKLTGKMPAELGNLAKLEYLFLRANHVSGCIPAELQEVPHNDFPSSGLTICDEAIPLAPTVQRATPGTGLLIIEWNAPLRDGGSDVTTYDLRYIESSSDETVDSNWTVVQDVWTTGNADLRHNLDGLTNGTGYDVQVRAVNSVGDGPWSTTISGTPETSSHCVTEGAVADATNTGLVVDCEALLEARDTLIGSAASATLNWAADTPISDWDGVWLDVVWLDGERTRRVSQLFLGHEDLEGTIPAALGGLSMLTDLRLSYNSLTGGIPGELGNLSNLGWLDLSDNHLTGAIPAELGNLANLDILKLHGNYLTGEIPEELGNLTNLYWLVLSSNRLIGEIPGGLGNLSNLEWLALDFNRLNGQIPVELGNLSANLQSLSLSWNQFSGCIPAELQDLPRNDLDSLGLSFCEVTAPLSPSISQVNQGTEAGLLLVGWDAPLRDGGSDITAYDLRYIETSVDETVDANWTVLQNVWTYDSDALQYTLTGLTEGTQYDLQVRAVNAVGDGPWSVTATAAATDAENDCTTGRAVPDAANNPGLVADCEALLEAKGDLVGGGSLNWTADTEMTQWHGVRLSGTPERVTRLILPQEGLSVAIPAALGRLSLLVELDLRTNQLAGEIPTELENLSNLERLDLGENQLTGEIPTELGDLSILKELALNHNMLTGQIPAELGNLTRLSRLYLANNLFTGCIPDELRPFRDTIDNDLDMLNLPFCGEATAPGPPDIAEVTGGASSLTIAWNAPSQTGGSAITAYDLRYIETAADETVESNWTVVEDVWTTGSGELQYTLTGLTAGKEYVLQVRAVNAVGDSPWSETATGTPTDAGDCTRGGAVPDPTNNPGLVSDCEVLRAARDTLAGAATLNWSADVPIAEWDGIEEDSLEGTPPQVVKLYLGGLGLDGTIPGELSGLTELKELYLQDNDLSGPIPPELGDLASLTHVHLQNNDLTGGIPVELGDIAVLRELRLDSNDLTGQLPLELGKLTKVTRLWVADNDLSGAIPAELGDMASLDWLNLGRNNLSGHIPAELGNLSRLRRLYIYENDLSGPIPDALGSLSRLTHIVAQANNLSGEIPAELGSLSNLVWLGLYDNDLTGEIPADLGNLAKLQRLYLTNNELYGEIPQELGDLSALTDLWLNHNYLSGQIPQSLDNLEKLSRLRLAGNRFTGCLPAGLAAVRNSDADQLGLETCTDPSSAGTGYDGRMEKVDAVEPRRTSTGDCATGGAAPDAANNPGLVSDCEALLAARAALVGTTGNADLNWSADTPMAEWDGIGDDSLEGSPPRVTRLYLNGLGLGGTIPGGLSGVTALKELYLQDNDLSGAIPSELGELSSLTHLHLQNNDLTGGIPAELGDLAVLRELRLDSNDLTGQLPPELGNLSRATRLWVADNDLSGAIPAELGDIANLDWLNLGRNNLSGAVPADLGDLSRMRRLYIYENDLSGAIPAALGNLERLTHIVAQANDLGGRIPTELGNLTNQVWMGLHDNDLTGEIPSELGGLAKLQRLYLTNNELYGLIPEQLGDLSALTDLWLNHNYLSGQIPQLLDNLEKLSRLRLAGNRFTGCLPAGLAAVRNSDADQLALETCSDS